MRKQSRLWRRDRCRTDSAQTVQRRTVQRQAGWWRAVRGFLPAAAVLLGIPALALWHSSALSVRAERWLGQLDGVERYARAGQWDAARSALEESRADWSAAHIWLHIASRHDAVDGAEALYGRCAALAEAEDGLLPELAELRLALGGLADRERLSLGNVL